MENIFLIRVEPTDEYGYFCGIHVATTLHDAARKFTELDQARDEFDDTVVKVYHVPVSAELMSIPGQGWSLICQSDVQPRANLQDW